MRGKITGFELLVRKEASHLLYTNGDTCHHIHNTSKKFSSTFNKHIEQLLTDLRTDMEWSTDLREYLKEICCLSPIPYSMWQQKSTIDGYLLMMLQLLTSHCYQH